MSIPSSAELLEELRAVETGDGDRLTDEQLAGRLPITLSTLNRWKKEEPRHYRSLMKMLRQAGWLNEDRIREATEAAAERERAEATERQAAGLAEREEHAQRKRLTA